MRMLISRFVNATPDRVFALVADMASWPEHFSAIKGVDVLTEGAIGVGTKFRETRHMMKGESVAEMEVALWEPPHAVVFVSDSCGVGFTMTQRFIAQRGGTLVELDMVSKANSWLGVLCTPMGWLFRGTMKKMIAKDFDDLAACFEETP